MTNTIAPPNNWSQLELRHLISFQAVARARSFWAASDTLDVSQSAVSQQVSTLERIVGQRLIERSPGRRQIALTEAGRLLLAHADTIVARVRAAQADFAAYAEGAAGSLRVGSYQSVSTHIVPPLLRQFTTAWPAVELSLFEEARDGELLQRVEQGELDLTFAIHPLASGPFAWVELLRDPYVLVLPATSPHGAAGARVRLRDLDGLKLVGFRHCTTSMRAEQILREKGIEPEFIFRSDDNGTVQAAVAAGVGAALAPRLSLELPDERLRVVELPELPWRTIVLAWHRDRYRSPASLAFQEAALSVCRGLSQAA